MTIQTLTQGICAIKECDNKEHGHGLCSKHLTWWRRHGDFSTRARYDIIPTKGHTLEDRFWSKVNKNGPTQPHMESECWLWIGAPSQRYGRLIFQGTFYAAHRLSWEMANGPMPEGMLACHRCDVPKCVRPEHIFPGTDLDNMRDKIAKGRANTRAWRLERPGAQPRGERVNTAKVTPEIVREIRRRRSKGEPLLTIAWDFDITRKQVSEIARHKCWKHIQ